MLVLDCRTCNAAHPEITSKERIKIAGKDDCTEHQCTFSHSDKEKGAISHSLSLLLLWMSLLSDFSCGKQQDSTHPLPPHDLYLSRAILQYSAPRTTTLLLGSQENLQGTLEGWRHPALWRFLVCSPLTDGESWENLLNKMYGYSGGKVLVVCKTDCVTPIL